MTNILKIHFFFVTQVKLSDMHSWKTWDFTRRIEPCYRECICIAEFWNTISNLPFVIIGLLRMGSTKEDELFQLYFFFVCAGVASFIHHGADLRWKKWTIWLDWTPIMLSLVMILNRGYLSLFSLVSWFKILVAISLLFDDHVIKLIPVPWGHTFWHLLAAFAMDSAYQDIRLVNIG